MFPRQDMRQVSEKSKIYFPVSPPETLQETISIPRNGRTNPLNSTRRDCTHRSANGGDEVDSGVKSTTPVRVLPPSEPEHAVPEVVKLDRRVRGQGMVGAYSKSRQRRSQGRNGRREQRGWSSETHDDTPESSLDSGRSIVRRP